MLSSTSVHSSIYLFLSENTGTLSQFASHPTQCLKVARRTYRLSLRNSSACMQRVQPSGLSNNVKHLNMDEFQKQNPVDASYVREQLQAFCTPLRGTANRIAVVTSGGTTVPLEKRCVRFLDNFSSGRRGAISTEELLKVRHLSTLSNSVALQAQQHIQWLAMHAGRVLCCASVTADISAAFRLLPASRELCAGPIFHH